MSTLTLVVGGAPALAAALADTGRFATVHDVGSTSQLRDIVTSGTLPSDKSRLVFLFADTMADDTPQTPLTALLGKLAVSGWRVIVLALSPNAAELVASHRAAGLLEGPFTVNSVIGAVAGLGLGQIDPVSEDRGGFEQFHPVSGPNPIAAAPTGDDSDAGSSDSGWSTVGDGWGGWGDDPQTQQTPANQTQPAQPQQQPAQPQQQQPQPAQPQPQPQPAQPQPQPQPAQPQQQPQPAQPQPAQEPASAGRRSLADAARTSGADTPQTSPQGWSDTPQPAHGGWNDPADGRDGPAQTGTSGPVPRGGPAVQQNPGRQRRGHVITISTSKGGTGKSSLSLNLAAFLGMRLKAQGKTVCIIDANHGQADIGKLLDVYSPNINDIVKDQSALTLDRITQFLVHRPELNLSALLGPPTSEDANPVYITPALYNQILDLLVELYDYVLVDSQVAEAHSAMHTEFAVARADYLIVPITPSLHTVMNADSWMRHLCRPKHAGGSGFDDSRIGVVLNMEMQGVEFDADDVMRELGSWQFIGAIPFTPVWQLALNRNELVATYNYTELNQAFSSILYAATGEQALMQAAPQVAEPEETFKDKILNLFRKGR